MTDHDLAELMRQARALVLTPADYVATQRDAASVALTAVVREMTFAVCWVKWCDRVAERTVQT